MHYVPKLDLRAVFNTGERHEAERLLKQAVEKHEKTAPRLARWMETITTKA